MENLTRNDRILAEYAACAYADALVKEADEAARESMPDGTVEHSIERLDTWFFEQLAKVDQANHKKTQQVRRRHILRVAAAVIVVIALSATVLIGTVEAVRIEFFNVIRMIFPSHTEFRMEGEVHSPPPSVLLTDYPDLHLPSYMPDGFAIKEIVGEGGNYLVLYESIDGRNLQITQADGHSGFGLDTEGAAVDEITIHDEPATLVTKGDSIALYMKSGAYAYLITSSVSSMIKDDMVRIAESFQ